MIVVFFVNISWVALIHEIWGCYHRKERQKSWGDQSRMVGSMHLTRSYHWSKGSLVRQVEDGALGNLAAAGDREENASHHDALGNLAAAGDREESASHHVWSEARPFHPGRIMCNLGSSLW